MKLLLIYVYMEAAFYAATNILRLFNKKYFFRHNEWFFRFPKPG